MGTDNPVRIAYQTESKTFGIGRIDVRPGGVVTTCRSSFVVLDARSRIREYTLPISLTPATLYTFL